MMKQTNRPAKPIVKVKPHSYQPLKAKLEADVRIDTTPQELARKLGQQMVVQETLLTNASK